MRRFTPSMLIILIGAMLILGIGVSAAPEEPAAVSASGEEAPAEESTTEPSAEGEAASEGEAEEGTVAPEEGVETGEAEVEPGQEAAPGEESAPDEEEGPPVRAIVVRGNRNVDAMSILNAIQATKVGEPLTVEKIQADLRSILEMGFFADVTVEAVQTVGGLRLVFEVLEYPVVEAIEVTSDEVDPEEIRSWMLTREGQVLNRIQLGEDLDRVQMKALEEYGLYLRPVTWEVRDGVLMVEFRATRVKEIRIRGNHDTRDYVIRREIVLKPGELLRRQDINRSIDRLQRLGFFQDIRVQWVDTDDPDYMIAEFHVDERMTGNAMVGAAYSSEDGLLGYAEVSDRNFLGRGQYVGIRAEFGQKRTVYDVGFYEPYLFGSTTSFGLNVYNRSFERLSSVDKELDYRERRSGGDVSFGRPLTEWTRVSVRYRAENLRTEAIGSAHQEKSGRTRSVTLASATDTTDHWLNPSRGIRSRLSAELGGGMLGGDFHFTKYEGEYSRYFQVGSQKQAIALRALGGWGLGHIREAEEQFRVGGATTVRGYPTNFMEGDRMLVFNAEYRFPLSDTVQGVVFGDAGEAWWTNEGSQGLKKSFGVGVRLDTPLGVLRLDYGIGDQGSRLHFFLGPSF